MQYFFFFFVRLRITFRSDIVLRFLSVSTFTESISDLVGALKRKFHNHFDCTFHNNRASNPFDYFRRSRALKRGDPQMLTFFYFF